MSRVDRHARWDRCTLALMALGVGLMVQPVWDAGFHWGFFLTLLGTIAQISVTHVSSDAGSSGS
jgi:hypothetical protein